MSEYPSLRDLIVYPFYLLMLFFGGSFAYVLLVWMFLWRVLIKKQYEAYRKWKNGN